MTKAELIESVASKVDCPARPLSVPSTRFSTISLRLCGKATR